MGLFVVFEGVEGSGKSTQSRELKRRLTKSGFTATLVREPGGTPTGQRIRQLLKGDHEITSMAELFLFLAARTTLIETVVRPALDKGEVVVCDRYIYSTAAYQGYGRGLNLDVIRQLTDLATGGLTPQIAFLLDLSSDEGFRRKSGVRLDRIERERDGFHQRVRQGYLKIVESESERWCVIDATKSAEEISEIVWSQVRQKVPKRVCGKLSSPPWQGGDSGGDLNPS